MIIKILAIYALSFILRNLAGPFNVLDRARVFLLRNKFVGVFTYELLSCPFCFGFWNGIAIYLLGKHLFNVGDLILWGFAGSSIVYLGDRAVELLEQFTHKD